MPAACLKPDTHRGGEVSKAGILCGKEERRGEERGKDFVKSIDSASED